MSGRSTIKTRSQAVGTRNDLGAHRRVRRKDPAHQGRPCAVGPVSQHQGRDGLSPSGQLIYRMWEGDTPRDVDLKIGEAFRITPGTVHQMEAVTDCDILEVSTPHLDDVVRTQGPLRARRERARHEGHHSAGRERHAPSPAHAHHAEADAQDRRQAGDRLRDGRPAATRQRRAGHLHHRASEGEGRGVRAREVSVPTPCSSSRRCRTARRARSRWRASYVDQPVFIIFVDTIFDADLSVVKRTDADGIIWVKTVEDYQRFGVVVTR